MSEALTYIGSIRSVNPARRELRVAPAAGYAHAFEGLEWLHVSPLGSLDPLRCKVESIEPAGSQVAIRLGPGVARDTIAKLKGASVVLPSEELKPAAPGEWQLRQLLNLRVEQEDGQALGTVVEIYEGRGDGAIGVEKPDGGIMLLPASHEVLTHVDLEREVITVGDVTPYATDKD